MIEGLLIKKEVYTYNEDKDIRGPFSCPTLVDKMRVQICEHGILKESRFVFYVVNAETGEFLGDVLRGSLALEATA